jgi:hypothetical protein
LSQAWFLSGIASILVAVAAFALWWGAVAYLRWRFENASTPSPPPPSRKLPSPALKESLRGAEDIVP